MTKLTPMDYAQVAVRKVLDSVKLGKQVPALVEGDIAKAAVTAYQRHARRRGKTSAWRPMETAPRDGTLLRLLVDFDDHPTDDTSGHAPTIGSNSFDNTGEDEWQFAGWCWTHDHFTEGKGAPVGWLPMLDTTPPTPSAPVVDDAVQAIACALAREDGYDPDDKYGGLYDLRWSGGPTPEPLGDAWAMDYLPKAERIAAALSGVSAPVGVVLPPRKNERDSDGKFRTVYLFDTPREQGLFQNFVASALTPAAAPSGEADAAAKKLYACYTDNQSAFDGNRFPAWAELDEDSKQGWRDQAKGAQP